MTNLFQDTLNVLKSNGKTWEDVKYIYTKDYQITKGNFETVAKNTNYNEKYLVIEINKNLKLLGDGFLMERFYNDCGYEGWSFINLKPNVPPKKIEIHKLGLIAEKVNTTFKCDSCYKEFTGDGYYAADYDIYICEECFEEEY